MLIDIHPHLISNDTVRYPVKPLAGERPAWSGKGISSAEQFLAAMKEAGVDRAVAVHPSMVYGYDNRYLADCVETYPGRLSGVCAIDFMAEDALEQLSYWLETRRMSGVRLFTRSALLKKQETWLDDPRTFPAWAWVQEHDIPMCIQIGAEGLYMLRNVMERFPRVRMILDNITSPDLSDGYPYANLQDILRLSDYPQLYLKISTVNFTAAAQGKSVPQRFMETLVSVYGGERIAWGSNFPATKGPLTECVELLHEACAGLSKRDRAAIQGETARTIYGL